MPSSKPSLLHLLGALHKHAAGVSVSAGGTALPGQGANKASGRRSDARRLCLCVCRASGSLPALKLGVGKNDIRTGPRLVPQGVSRAEPQLAHGTEQVRVMGWPQWLVLPVKGDRKETAGTGLKATLPRGWQAREGDISLFNKPSSLGSAHYSLGSAPFSHTARSFCWFLLPPDKSALPHAWLWAGECPSTRAALKTSFRPF